LKSARKPRFYSFSNNGGVREARGPDPGCNSNTNKGERRRPKEKSPPRFPPESPHHLISTRDVATSNTAVKPHRFGGQVFYCLFPDKSGEGTGKLWAKRSS
jgi:hypothetical protein